MTNPDPLASHIDANEAFNMEVDQQTVDANERIFEDMVGASEAYFSEAERVVSAQSKTHNNTSDPEQAILKARVVAVNSSLYPSTPCNLAFVQLMTEEGSANGYATPAPELCGFTLMGNRLVPETFVQNVQAQLENFVFDYGAVLSQEILFDLEFLDLLDADQRTVLMPTVLLLAARGTLPLNLWASKAFAN
jgi:hypothetical protein